MTIDPIGFIIHSINKKLPVEKGIPAIATLWIAVFSFILSLQLPLAASEASNVDKYAEIFFKARLFRNFQLSPDGSHLSMILHKDSGDVLATMDIETGKAKSASGQPGQQIYRYGWVDADTLAFQVSFWDAYDAGLYIADEDLNKFTLFGTPETDHTRGLVFSKEWVVLGDPLPQVKGKMLLVDKTRDEQFPEAYTYDHIENKVTDRQKNGKRIGSWGCDTSGRICYIARLTEPGEVEHLHRKDKDSEWTELPFPQDTDVLGFNVAGDRIFVSYPDEEGIFNFRIFDLNKMAYVGKAVTHPVYAATPSLLRDVSSGALVGLSYEWEKPQIVYLDPGYRAIHKQLQTVFPGKLCQILGQTRKKTILIKVFSDIHPVRIYELYPGEKMTMKLILDQAEWIPDDICQPMEPITFPARDGTEIHGYLTRARNSPDKEGPTVMYIHGGPRSRDEWGFDSMAQYLSNLGYHVIQVNYRGSSGFNESYSIKHQADICRLSTKDIADAARWAISEGIADEERIAIFGGSYGGYAALAGAAFEPDLYKVAIGFAGVYDYDRQMKNTYRGKEKVRDWLEPFIGDIAENPEEYTELSPANFADQIKAKVLLIHGGADHRVSISQSRIMAKALRKAGNKPTVETTAWGIHGFADEKKHIDYGKQVGQFLKDNL